MSDTFRTFLRAAGRNERRRLENWAFSSFLPAALMLVVLVAVAPTGLDAAGADRPNILWITCEDINPNLGVNRMSEYVLQ